MKNIDAERAAFEAWYVNAAGESRKFMLGMNTDGTYSYAETESMWEAWQGSAARRTPSPSIGEDGLPELSDERIDELAKPWAGMGGIENQYAFARTIAREAIAADRRARASIDRQLTGDPSPVKQAAQGVPVAWMVDFKRAPSAMIGRAYYWKYHPLVAEHVAVGDKVTPLYAAPLLSSEPQAEKGKS